MAPKEGTHPSDTKVRCTYCSATFPNRQRMVSHAQQVHGKTPTSPKLPMIGGIIAVLVIGAAVAVIVQQGTDRPETREEALRSLAVAGDPSLGDPKAPVAVVAFESPVCSGCKWFHENLFPQLSNGYFEAGHATFYYQHFDTYGRTGHARLEEGLSMTMECLNEHVDPGVFWKWTGFLYENQFQVTLANMDANMREFATAEGFDPEPVLECTHGRDHLDEYRDDVAAGHRLGVRGTPSFYVVHGDGTIEEANTQNLEAKLFAAVEAAG